MNRRACGATAFLVLAVGVALGVVGVPQQEAKLVAADAARNDRLGFSVAVSGDTAVAGAPRKDSSRGAAYVFTRTGSTWTQQAVLVAAAGANGDEFGYSVAVDGGTAVVGAYNAEDYRGAAYVFTRTGSTWTQQAKLAAADGVDRDQFGVSVAIAGDTVIVGAAYATSNQGSAYVFTRTGTTWTQQAELTASDPANGDYFAIDVALEGGTALIGASNKANYQGAAYVFTGAGATWTQQAKLTASDGAASDEFGYSVALAGDTAVLGAYGVSEFRGAAYVFKRTGTVWTQQQKLLASDGVGNQAFGVAVAAVGDTAVVGGSVNLRGAYVFTRTGDVWTEAAKFTGADGTQDGGGGFGASVATFGDTLVVGADSKTFDTGAAYVLDLAPAGAPRPGYVLPAKVKANFNAKAAAKSTLTASGTLDTGPGVPDFSGPATFDIADFRLSIPAFVPKGRSLTYSAGGVTLTITPARNGSSRATFSVKVVGDLGGRVELNAAVPFNFSNQVHNVNGTAKLTLYSLRPLGVTAPDLAVLAAGATIKGGGRDTLNLKLAFPTDGVVPGGQTDVTVGFGGTYTTMLAGGWVRKGSTYVHTAKAPGITKAVVDYAKGTITIAGSRLDLGTFAAGGNAVVVTVTRGADTRSVAVRMARSGVKLAY